jgi:hypothetical protein
MHLALEQMKAWLAVLKTNLLLRPISDNFAGCFNEIQSCANLEVGPFLSRVHLLYISDLVDLLPSQYLRAHWHPAIRVPVQMIGVSIENLVV